MTHRQSAAELIDLVADPGSFRAWDTDVVSDDPLGFHDTMAYADRLRLTAERSGVTEAIATGRACIDGHDVVLVVGEFGFLAGTLGVATAERVVRAFERATDEGVPVIALPVSGGTRMQEGTAAFVQMASCAAAVRRFRDAGLPYVVYLRDPTTGGVLASWASLAHVRFAEPGALIGLTGPRVVKEMTGESFPEGVQVSENLCRHGVVDALVPLEELRERVAAVLRASRSAVTPWLPEVDADVLGDEVAVDAWDAVTHSRRVDRPGVAELLRACDAAPWVALRGDGAGTDDPGCLVAMTRVCGVGAIVIAQWREPGERGASLSAAGYRKAARAMRLAEELGLPIMTVVDTAGAAMTAADEQSGLAAMIADCLSTMSAVRVPTLSVLLGEGTGGGAIALLPADRVVAAQHGWLAPVAPEGASAILYRTADRAAEVARAQSVASTDLRRLGIVDAVVADTDDAAPQRLAAVIGAQLRSLVAQDSAARLIARRDRYRTIAR